MRLIRAFCRFVFGLTFILSGFLKALDPVGFSLKINEYLIAFKLTFLDIFAEPLAIFLPVVEFVIGVSVLKGLKVNVFSRVALCFIGFFTLLTFFVALFDPVNDCGCFGEAIPLSNWETFIKNIILSIAAVIVFYGKDNVKKIASSTTQWIYIGLYTLIIVIIALYSYISVPFIDFGVYRLGTDLVETQNIQQNREYQTTFIYEKDGVQENFTLDNLPDSSWVYVDTKTVQVYGEEEDPSIDFAIRDSNGDYVSDELLSKQNPVFIISYYEDKVISESDSTDIATYAESLVSDGSDVYVLTLDPEYNVSKILPQNTLYADYKTIISFNRSNGGLTYLDNGVVVHKWADWNFPNNMTEILETDHEVLTIVSEMKDRILFWGILILVYFLIIIVRALSLIVYKIKQRGRLGAASGVNCKKRE